MPRFRAEFLSPHAPPKISSNFSDTDTYTSDTPTAHVAELGDRVSVDSGHVSVSSLCASGLSALVAAPCEIDLS